MTRAISTTRALSAPRARASLVDVSPEARTPAGLNLPAVLLSAPIKTRYVFIVLPRYIPQYITRYVYQGVGISEDFLEFASFPPKGRLESKMQGRVSRY